MPERDKLVVITDRPVLRVPLPNVRKMARIERYLGRQVRAAHNLGLPLLERYYSTGWLSFRLWRMELPEAAVQQTPSPASAKAVQNQRLAAGEKAVQHTDVCRMERQ